MPQLHGFFWSQMLKQYLKRILNKRLVGKLGAGVVLSDGFHSVVEIAAGSNHSASKMPAPLSVWCYGKGILCAGKSDPMEVKESFLAEQDTDIRRIDNAHRDHEF